MRTRFLILILLVFPQVTLAVTRLQNPLGTTDIPSLIGRIVSAMLGLSGALALAMFVWGGFQWLISGGDPSRVTKGKETLYWATIGLVVIFSSYTLVQFLIRALAG